MIRIEIDEHTAERLGKLATAQGLSLADYLRSIAGTGTDLKQPPPAEFDFDAELAALTFDGPTLPAVFSRADIYCDHD